MIRELARLLKSKGILAILLLSLILIFVIAGIYSVNSENKTAYLISEYKALDEIPKHIEAIEQQIDELENKHYDTANEIENLRITIRIYRYLLENEISYEYLVENITSAPVTMFVADKLDYTQIMWATAILLILVVVIILAAVIVNSDFTSGVYRQLYSTGIPRKTIFRQKASAFFCANGAVFIIFSFVIFITGLIYKVNYGTTLIVDAKNIYTIGTAELCALSYLSALVTMLFFSTVIFAVSALIRNIYAAVLANGLFIGVYAVGSSFSSGFAATITSELTSYYAGSAGFGIFVLVYILKIAIAIGLLILSRRIFLRKDL
ncbi:MAG: ABC transporter permease subunit [Clostridiales bacterium]|jgi:hypothetical protein|nr:ABC transporter permease subunit [Clostridiales bacterium]